MSPSLTELSRDACGPFSFRINGERWTMVERNRAMWASLVVAEQELFHRGLFHVFPWRSVGIRLADPLVGEVFLENAYPGIISVPVVDVR